MPSRKPRTKGGRPSLWTPAVAFHLGEAVSRGMPLAAAPKRAKIGRSTLHRWVAAAHAGDPEFTPQLKLIEPASASRFPW
jgi:hypothetical protein